MKALMVCLLLLSGCESTTSVGSQIAAPEPVVAEVTRENSPEVETLSAQGFQLSLFEDGPARISLEAKNEHMVLVIVAIIADEWKSSGAPFVETLSLADPGVMMELNGVVVTQGVLKLQLKDKLQLEGSFDVTMQEQQWTAALTGRVLLACHTKSGSLQQRGGAPIDGAPSWWVDTQFETAFCKESAHSLGL